jgi:hypothetical protein
MFQGIDDSECCLLSHVPKACIYLCDSSVAPENHMSPLCLQYMSSVERCRVTGVELRPNPVDELRAQTTPGTNALTVHWGPSLNAEIYHLYWKRRHEPNWHQQSLIETQKRIGGADDVVLVAANAYGLSQAARLMFNNSRWIRV